MVNRKKSALAAVVGMTAIVAGVLGVPRDARAALLISSGTSATALANTIVAPNSGITISGATFTGASTAAGTFGGGNTSGFPINSGIILSTGSVTTAANLSSTTASTNNNTAGDTALNGLAGKTTFDAASLLFNFTLPTGSNGISVNYAFASDEYAVSNPNNDILGIFVDGGTNIARITGTNTPVSPNSVNSTTNSGLFVNNAPITPAPTNPAASQNNVAYNGFTNALTANITGLAAGQHTIRFAIADATDNTLDSAVVIQSGSLAAIGGTTPPGGGTSVPEPSSTLGILAVGVLGAGRLLKQKLTKKAVKASTLPQS